MRLFKKALFCTYCGAHLELVERRQLVGYDKVTGRPRYEVTRWARCSDGAPEAGWCWTNAHYGWNSAANNVPVRVLGRVR